MPQLSPIEILVVATIALIVFGPEKLPQIARTIGRSAAELRRMANEVKDEFQAGLDLDLDDEDETPKPSRRPHPNEAATRTRTSDGDAPEDRPAPLGDEDEAPPVSRGLSAADGDGAAPEQGVAEGAQSSETGVSEGAGSESDAPEEGSAGSDDGSGNGRGPGGR
jgi:sec-independent protein translocase protein TatB